MSRIVLFLCLLVSYVAAFGQLQTWELSASPGNQASNTATTNAVNTTAGTLQRGSGVAASSAGGSISSNGWFASATPTTLADAITNGDYYEFTLPIDAGFKATVTSVVVVLRGSNTGPNTVTLRSSADAYTANLGTASVTYNLDPAMRRFLAAGLVQGM